MKESSKSNVPIVEINPGLGILTEKLLQIQELNQLFLIDMNDSLLTRLEQIQNSNKTTKSKDISFIRSDFIGLWRLFYLDKINKTTKANDLLSALPKADWKDEVGMKIFLPIGSLAFFKHLILSIISGSSIATLGRQEFYAALPPRLYIVSI